MYECAVYGFHCVSQIACGNVVQQVCGFRVGFSFVDIGICGAIHDDIDMILADDVRNGLRVGDVESLVFSGNVGEYESVTAAAGGDLHFPSELSVRSCD